jgi:hypothetical protein
MSQNNGNERRALQGVTPDFIGNRGVAVHGAQETYPAALSMRRLIESLSSSLPGLVVSNPNATTTPGRYRNRDTPLWALPVPEQVMGPYTFRILAWWTRWSSMKVEMK